MRRRFLPLAALVLGLSGTSSLVHGQAGPDLNSVAEIVAGLQNEDGGFAPSKGQASTLGATSSAIRILGYVGGSIPDPLGAIAFLKRCRDEASGGFAPTPGATPDVGTTASALMALGELNVGDQGMIDAGVKYLDDNARSYEEVRIAAAALESVGAKTSKLDIWTRLLGEGRNADGTWGSGPSRAFDTGGRTVALLRLGQPLDRREAIAAAIKQAQQADGGWSATGASSSDLGATYRIMRACYMLGEKPDLQKLRGLVARCRDSNGLYASAPGKSGDLGGTYLATILLRWARLLDGEPAIVETAGFRPLFNGKDLEGWDGDKALWSVENGVLVGNSPGIDHNTFLAAPGNHADFVLKFVFRLQDGRGNSGVQFRSVRVPPHEMSGYQADIGENYSGCLYDESRRNKVLAQASEEARKAVRPADWNSYTVRALGDQISLALNGVRSVEYRETDSSIASDGQIAVQIHAGGPMRIEFKDLWIQDLPRPVEDGSTAPGFHLRTLVTDGKSRKYSLFIPKSYDGTEAFPAVLFLHGAGERGTDGIVPAQVGLGAAIAQNPLASPFIAVFPQAERTWQSGSDDAAAALATLDAVQRELKVDPDRIILTGLSMGGAGSWSIAAAHPEKFAAVVPVCGFGDTDTALKLVSTPVWSLLGDDDSDRIVQGTRRMISALREAGALVRHTEYRAVGHNSWDRAYNDPKLIGWMLAQSRRPTQ
jgi:pimeloyl-ACP methyl ester carboxylesterase